MAENGVVRFAGNLDPCAQEFRPVYSSHYQQQYYQYHPSNLFYPTHQPELLYPPLQLPPPPPLTTTTPTILPPPAKTPTRALLLSSVPSHASESQLRRELEVFGDVRAVQMDRLREGFVTVHFYDLRAAHAALDAVRYQHMQHQHRLRLHYSSPFLAPNDYSSSSSSFGPPFPPPAAGIVAGCAVWAQFAIPVTNAFPDGTNQGTIVVFNLDPGVSTCTLKNIFQAFGTVKELRETPLKKQQRFIEFFDVRDASRALTQMNGQEICGRKVLIEFSRPGGSCYRNKQYPQLEHRPPPAGLPLRNRRVSPRQQKIASTERRRSVERAMNGLTLEEKERQGIQQLLPKNSDGDGNCSSSSGGGSTTMIKETKLVRPLKVKPKKFDPKFMIKEGAIAENNGACRDTRTTVMIKNIPNKYSQKLLLNMLDNHCIHCNEQISGEDQSLSSYDFVYLPIDFNNKCNVGYGFVNMTSPEATLRLYKAFHHQHWEVFNSRKICEVTYARVQGVEALKEHFKNSKFACQKEDYLPVLFSPPRDGRQLSAPIPIVLTTHLPPNSSSSTLDHDHNQSHHDDDDLDGAHHLTSSSSWEFQQDQEEDAHHINPIVSDEHDVASSGGHEDVINDGDEGCSDSSGRTERT